MAKPILFFDEHNANQINSTVHVLKMVQNYFNINNLHIVNKFKQIEKHIYEKNDKFFAINNVTYDKIGRHYPTMYEKCYNFVPWYFNFKHRRTCTKKVKKVREAINTNNIWQGIGRAHLEEAVNPFMELHDYEETII